MIFRSDAFMVGLCINTSPTYCGKAPLSVSVVGSVGSPLLGVDSSRSEQELLSSCIPVASLVVGLGLSCRTACGIFPDQGWSPCPLRWQVGS